MSQSASSPSLSDVAADPRVPGATALTRVVALDGPAGTGKSSVAKGVASRLGWRFVDTGATYRAVTLAVVRAGVDLEDADGLARVAARCRVELVTDPAGPLVLLDGEDVSAAVRSPEVTAAVSAVSAVPEIRQLLIALQRAASGTEGAVVEGRDIATVVAPHALLKVYLDARPEVRAQRRAAELGAGVSGAATAVGEALRRRDHLDSQTNRLEASDGALHLDTSDLTLDQVIDEVVALVRARS